MKGVAIAILLMLVFNGCSRGEQKRADVTVDSKKPDSIEQKTPDVSVDPKKFDEVHRAGQAVRSAIDLGVAVARYRELLQVFDTEVAIARDNAANEPERQVAAMYSGALDCYKDALPIWSLKFDPSNELRRKWIGHDDGLVFPDNRHSQIIARYGIPYAPSEGRAVKAISGDAALKRIWEAASKKLEAANKASRGR